MTFVDKLDIFLFYEDKIPRQVYLTADLLNKQLKSLLTSDLNVQNNIEYLSNIFNTLYENKPKDMLENILNDYYKLPTTEKSLEYQKLFTDFGTIKHWINEN